MELQSVVFQTLEKQEDGFFVIGLAAASFSCACYAAVSQTIKMTKTETTQQQHMDNVPPAGYPTLGSPEGNMKKKGLFRTKQRGEKGFIEGCLATLCCCWICEECCC